MSPSWVHSELKIFQTGGMGSADFNRLSKSAQVLPQRYLLEQLKFYPQLDPTGSARAFLEGYLDGKKATSTPAVTYGDQSATPRSPGAWLNGLVMPVEITRLPNGSWARHRARTPQSNATPLAAGCLKAESRHLLSRPPSNRPDSWTTFNTSSP